MWLFVCRNEDLRGGSEKNSRLPHTHTQVSKGRALVFRLASGQHKKSLTTSTEDEMGRDGKDEIE